LHQAISRLEQACEFDDQFAGTWYTLGECYRAVGRMDEARHAFLEAKELDICPLRALKPMNDFVLELARETHTPLLDAQEFFERKSRDGIVDGQWLVDHVHPGIEGHQLLADELAQMLVALDIVHSAPDWESQKYERYRAHLDALPPIYFEK